MTRLFVQAAAMACYVVLIAGGVAWGLLTRRTERATPRPSRSPYFNEP